MGSAWGERGVIRYCVELREVMGLRAGLGGMEMEIVGEEYEGWSRLVEIHSELDMVCLER